MTDSSHSHVLFAGCGPHEVARARKVNGSIRGVFTSAFLEVADKNPMPFLRCSDILQEINVVIG